MHQHLVNHANLRLESAFDCFQATAEKKAKKDYINCNVSESTQLTSNLSQSTLSKNGQQPSLINKNLIGIGSGINGGLNQIASLQAFEMSNQHSSKKLEIGDTRHHGPAQVPAMVRYNNGALSKQNQPVMRIGQCRSHDKIVGNSSSQSFIGNNSTPLHEEKHFRLPNQHNFKMAASNQQTHYQKMLKHNESGGAQQTIRLMGPERMNQGQNSNQVRGGGGHAGTIQANMKTIRQIGCRSNDNEIERNHRKAIIEVAAHHMQSGNQIGQGRRNQQVFKTKTKVMNPSIIEGKTSRNDQKLPIFGSQDSIINSQTNQVSKMNQNSRSKLHQKHTRNNNGQNSGVSLNFAKLKNTTKNIISGNAALHSQQAYDPKKENIDYNNRNQEIREHNDNSSVVRASTNAQNLRTLYQQNSNNLNIRRNFGSNDSHTNAAPQQKKYMQPNRFQQSKSSIKMRDLKISSVMLNQPRQFEQNEAPQRMKATRGVRSKKPSIQVGETSLQTSQNSQGHPYNKSVLSTNGNGSENVSTICQGEAPQRQIHTSIIHQQPIKDVTSQLAAISKQKHRANGQNKADFSAFTNIDLNFQNEYQFDKKAQSVLQTVSTIQTEHAGMPEKAVNHIRLQNEGMLKGLYLKQSQAAQNAVILEHLGFGTRSSRGSSTTSNESQNSANCKSRESCSRQEIQINDARDLKQSQIRKSNMNLLVRQQNEMRIEEMNSEQRCPTVGNQQKPYAVAPPEQQKNGKLEQIQDFCSYDSDSYSEYSVQNQVQKQTQNANQIETDQIKIKQSSSNNQINSDNFRGQVNHQIIIKRQPLKQSKHISVDTTQENQNKMTDKENTAAAPASHIAAGRRQSLTAAGPQIGVVSTKAASSNRLITCKDVTSNPRSQQVVPAKAVGLLSGAQAHALQRGNAGSRQKTDTVAAISKGNLIITSKDNARKTFRGAGQVNDQKQSQVRQIKSLSHLGDPNGVSSNQDTVESEKMQQPLSVNKNLTNINSSTEQSNAKENVNSQNLVDKQSFDGCPGFNLQRVPTTSTAAISREQRALSKTRCVSQNKSDNSGKPAPASYGSQSEINVSVTPLKAKDKKLRLVDFRQNLKKKIESGEHSKQTVYDLHSSQQEREILDNVLKMHGQHPSCLKNDEPVPNPIGGHEVTKEYRTKMTDWMVEVCTSFKCTARTYFLAVQIFDKYLTRLRHQGRVLQNKDVHCIGVTAMYLASKYEDIFPLHSKIVSDKIAHKAIASKEILKKEGEFLNVFDFEMDFITHFDFHQTYADKLSRKLPKNVCQNQGEYLSLLLSHSMLLLKMAMQNNSFTPQSPSVLAVSALYAATGFLKNSRKHNMAETARFCSQARKAILELVEEDAQTAKEFKKNKRFRAQISIKLQGRSKSDMDEKTNRVLDTYARQFNQQNLERTSMRMVEFFKVFDDWHCGLNQLKKFNKATIE